MADEREDFWPDDIVDADDPEPVAILKEQAARLGMKTSNAVEGVVRMTAEEGTAYYDLCLKSEELGDYLYKILYIAHPVISRDDAYPITAQSSAGGPEVTLSDGEEFRDWLRRQLSSDFVRRAIANLLRSVREVRQATTAR
jgi:hypothetical protein